MNTEPSAFRKLLLPAVALAALVPVTAAAYTLVINEDGNEVQCTTSGDVVFSGNQIRVNVASGCLSTEPTEPTEPPPEEPPEEEEPPPPSTGGDDPGTGLWKPQSHIYVFDRSRQSSDNHVPGCIPTEYQQCQWAQDSQYVSVKAGEVWSMRIPFSLDASGSYLSMPLARGEAGENSTLSRFDVAITKTPGAFNTSDSACRRTNVSTYSFSFKDAIAGAALWGGCPLDRNTMYYFNVRPAAGTESATRCGTNNNTHCRFRIINRFSTSNFSD
ncbi:hypothetical protein [Thioalkalivibrio thiocyanodenitrificans]|uniref:hypothetical protein n=1 Tax=Thioalkalivibrio thiocyanodenitrificans TaxID=243063 RepID=UPI00037B92D0|nr:hypothetical protein [Thioalkalivibrio thiocyanodenitrificans]